MVTAMAAAAPTPVAPAVSVPAPASAAASPPTELAPAAPAPAPVEPATEVPGALTLSQPTYLDNPAPVYPPLARRRGWEGVTVLRVEVLADGTPRGIGVVRSSGHRVLDNTALAAVRRWRFQPARRGAQPVISQLEIPIRFQLLGD
ncbi:energy transducer TonB [bacterium]|nr:energy transducer TonB [bacterium]